MHLTASPRPLMRRPWLVALTVAAALAAAAVVAAWCYPRWSGFEPGGGGAEELPIEVSADGSLRVQLRLKVWGGGGAIAGRYQGVALHYRTPPAVTYQQVEGTRVQGDSRSEVYAFSLPRPSGNAAATALDYFFLLRLDGEPSSIPGKQAVALQAAAPASR